MPRTSAAERRRLSANLPPDVSRLLDQLTAETGDTPTEIVQDAIKLLAFVRTESSQGRRIFSVDANGENGRELVLL